MTIEYKNPSADQYVAANYSFFRLKQSLASAGDIFEVPQGAHGFAIGPDSDISLATVAYFDPLGVPAYNAQATPKQNNMSTLSISPQRPWAGYIPVTNKEAGYAPSAVPGRMLVWPTEIYDATVRPFGFNPVTDGLVYETPVIDIIQYFSPPPAVLPQRTDKTYYYEGLPIGDSGRCFVMIPFYGRRYASIWAVRTAAGVLLTVQARGVNFRIAEGQNTFDALIDNAPDALSLAGGPQTIVVRPNFYDAETTYTSGVNQRGLWDYLAILVTGDGSFEPSSVALRVVVSDTNP